MRQSQSLALAAGALVLVLVLGWLFLFGVEPSDAAAPAAAEHVDAARADAALDRQRNADARASGEELHSARLATELGAPSLPEDSATAPSRGVELIAVRGSARERVDGVAMWWWPEGERVKPPDGDKFEDLYFEGRLDEQFEAHAEALAPDEAGRFFAPSGAASAGAPTGIVVASAPGLWGYTFVHRAEPSPCFIELEPDADIEVRVVDVSGLPVSGARVALRGFFRAGASADHVRAYTAANGRAQLRHVIRAVGANNAFSEDLRVSLADPMASDVGVPIDLDNLPETPIELVMPTTGAVEVVFANGEVTDETDGLWVALRVVSRDAPEDEALPAAVPTPRRAEHGAVLFPFVPVGYDVVASTRRAERGWWLELVRGRGPSRAGETAQLEFRFEGRSTTLRGRLLHADGAAACTTEFGYSIGAPEPGRLPTFERDRLQTDVEGRFETRFAVEFSSEQRLTFVARDAQGRAIERASSPMRSAAVGGVVDVGDLRLTAIPTLAAGVVLDVAGKPVAFAAVEVHEPRRIEDSGVLERIDWTPRWSDETKTDAQGRFRIAGESATSTVALWAKCGDRRAEPTEVSVGDERVVLTLAWDGAITGRVLLPPSIAGRHVSFKATEHELAPDALRLRDWRSPLLDDSGEFVFRGLAPGAYDLVVEADGADEPIGRVENVRVDAGRTTRDARLDPLDLRASADFANLRVLSLDGEPIPVGGALWFSGSDDEAIASNWFYNGRLRLPRALAAPTVWICADDHILTAVDPATVGDEVRLRPAQRVRVELADGVALPEPPLELSVTLRARGEPEWLDDECEDSLEFKGERSATGLVRRFGALEATLWLFDKSWGECATTIVEGGVLVESPNVQTIVLSVDPEALAAAVADARASGK